MEKNSQSIKNIMEKTLRKTQSTKGYTSIKIPKVLSEKILSIADTFGYRSVSEFVMEATREHLKRIQE